MYLITQERHISTRKVVIPEAILGRDDSTGTIRRLADARNAGKFTTWLARLARYSLTLLIEVGYLPF